MDPIKEIDENTEANRVIEYYKRYSQNPDLFKYFTGPEASIAGKKSSNVNFRKNVPSEEPKLVSTEVDKIEENDKCPIQESQDSSEIMQSTSPVMENDKISELEEIEDKNPSRSSSVASNKIEWDNGADIGYKNSYEFLATRKSASFPSLLTNKLSVNTKALPQDTQEKSITDHVQELRKMYTQLTFSTETSSSSNKENSGSSMSKEQSQVGSSLPVNKNLKTSTKSSSSSSGSYLRRKIGYPIAYSTPHEGSSSKECVSKTSKENSSENSKESSSTSKKKDIKSSNKPECYFGTPMLTLPVKPKRNVIDVQQSTPSENKGKVENASSQEQVDFEKIGRHTKKIQKKINLCLTKPISVECFSLDSKQSEHKTVQTSVSSEKSSKFVQTEDFDFDPLLRYTPHTQNVEYVKFKENSNASLDSPQVLESSKNVSSHSKNCKSTQTDYIARSTIAKRRNIIRNTKESRSEKIMNFAEPKILSKKKIINDSTGVSSTSSSEDPRSTSENAESTDTKTPEATKEFQTEEMLLAEMISLNYSKDLNTDIKRSIDVLQKLLRSKKYDQATKKHYIKKIVQKIVNTKYSDDSTNSDLFKSKKNHEEPETKVQDRIHKQAPKLMENLPWYPVAEPKYRMPKNITNNKETEYISKVKTVIVGDDMEPTKDVNNFINKNIKENQTFIVPKQKENMKIPQKQVNSTRVPLISPKDIHTTSNSSSNKSDNQHFKQKQRKSVKNDHIPKFTSNSSSKLLNNPVLRNDNRPTSSEGKIGNTNWRTAKTLSEKLLENRDLVDFKKGQGDYLLHVAKNERHHQLSWIKNEIEHLVKLKELLEKKPGSVRPDSKLKDVISSLLKMRVDDMEGGCFYDYSV